MGSALYGHPRTPLGVEAMPQWPGPMARRHVARCASLDGWTAASSLMLVEAICSGPGGLDRAARATGRTRGDCAAHWARLMPASYRGGIDNQAQLLTALRQEAGL